MTENEVPAQRLSYKHFSSTNPLKVRISSELWQKQYVSSLGDSLIPAGVKGTKRPIEFRFFVVEDLEINAASLPDGTLLINTGLLGALENEAQLAFVLSHEMAHVLPVHYRREVEETRGSRIGLTIAGVAAGGGRSLHGTNWDCVRGEQSSAGNLRIRRTGWDCRM